MKKEKLGNVAKGLKEGDVFWVRVQLPAEQEKDEQGERYFSLGMVNGWIDSSAYANQEVIVGDLEGENFIVKPTEVREVEKTIIETKGPEGEDIEHFKNLAQNRFEDNQKLRAKVEVYEDLLKGEELIVRKNAQ